MVFSAAEGRRLVALLYGEAGERRFEALRAEAREEGARDAELLEKLAAVVSREALTA